MDGRSSTNGNQAENDTFCLGVETRKRGISMKLFQFLPNLRVFVSFGRVTDSWCSCWLTVIEVIMNPGIGLSVVITDPNPRLLLGTEPVRLDTSTPATSP